MKNISKTILAIFATGLISCALCTQQAQAVPIPITGGVSFAGGYTTDTGNVNTAHAFLNFSNVNITSVAGSYLGVPTNGTVPVTMMGFTFNPFVPPVNSLWDFMFSGKDYSFDLLAITSRQQNGDNTLTLHGLGTLHITGFDNTAGSWVLTANQGGGTFSFSSSNGAIPDGGTTVALLGIALAGIEGVRRMFRARKA
jgi:hypothetical protein